MPISLRDRSDKHGALIFCRTSILLSSAIFIIFVGAGCGQSSSSLRKENYTKVLIADAEMGLRTCSSTPDGGTVDSGLGSARENERLDCPRQSSIFTKRESTGDTCEIHAPKGSKSHYRIPDN